MTKEQNALLEILKFYFWGDFEESIVQDSDIFLVMEESRKQGVFNFFASSILKLKESNIIPINDKIIKIAKADLIFSMASSGEKIRIQKEILESISKKNIIACLLKGTSISVFYPEPMLRYLGDLDILVYEEDLNEINNIVCEKGFCYEKSSTNYHLSYVSNSLEIEVHKFVAGLPGGKMGKVMNNLNCILENCERGDLNMGNYFVPGVEDNGLVQILHILHHTIDRGLKLRLLCDWMMYVNKNITNDKWNESKNRYHKYGLDCFACILTSICSKYLGLPDDITWGSIVDEKRVDMYLEYLFNPWEKYTPIENKNRIDVPMSEMGSYMYKKKGLVLLVYRTINSLKFLISGKKTLGQIRINIHNRSIKKKKIKMLGIIPKKYIGDYVM